MNQYRYKKDSVKIFVEDIASTLKDIEELSKQTFGN